MATDVEVEPESDISVDFDGGDELDEERESEASPFLPDVAQDRMDELPDLSQPQAHPASGTVVCINCGATNTVPKVRCRACGSSLLNQVRPQPQRATTPRQDAPASPRNAMATVNYSDFYNLSPYLIVSYTVAAALQLFINTWLGTSILMLRPGPRGLHPTTYAWQYPLGLTLLASAFAAGLGCYLLFYLRKSGAILVAVAFALDLPLLLWLIYYDAFGTLGIWPGAGPYLVLLLVCMAATVDLIRIVRKGELT